MSQNNPGFPDAGNKALPPGAAKSAKARAVFDPSIRRLCANPKCGERVYAHWTTCLCGTPVPDIMAQVSNPVRPGHAVVSLQTPRGARRSGGFSIRSGEE